MGIPLRLVTNQGWIKHVYPKRKNRVSNKEEKIKQEEHKRKIGKSLKPNRNGRGRSKLPQREGKGKGHQGTKAEGGAGALTVVDSLEGVVGGVQDPFPEVLHSLSPGQLLSKRSLPGT